MSLFAKDIEEAYRATLELGVLDAKLGHSLLDEARQPAGLTYAGKVALHIGHKAGYACLTECLGHHLKRDGLSRTCGSGNESMTVSHLTCNAERSIGAMGDIQPSLLVIHKDL
jgi:hypothetical protein